MKKLIIFVIILITTIQCQAVTWYAKTTGDLSVITYNDQAGGGGADKAWGAIPDTDVIDANGNTVAIDVYDWTRLRLQNTTGGFTYALTGDRIIICDIKAIGATCITATHTSGNSLTINGDFVGGSEFGAIGIKNASSGAIIINGDGSGGSNGGAIGIDNDSTGTLIVNGDVAGSSVLCIENGSTGTVTINGSISGGTGSSSYGIENKSTGVVTLNLRTLVFDPTLESPVTGKNIYYTFGSVSYFSAVGGQSRILSSKRGYRGRYK